MTLDTLIRIIGRDEGIGLITVLPYFQPKEEASFLWATVVERTVIRTDESQLSFNETNEVVDSFFESTLSKKIYVARDIPLERVKNYDVKVSEDLTFRIFGSIDLYKSFFIVLNSEFQIGNISNEQYMQIYQSLNDINSEVYNSFFNKYALHKLARLSSVERYIKDRGLSDKTSQLIIEYLSRARIKHK